MLICQLSDLHVRPRGVAAYRVVETNMLVERAIRKVLALSPAPDVVLITGDLTDCGRDDEYALLAPMLRRLPMPVYVIPGNHDRREKLRRGLAFLPGMAGRSGFAHYVVDSHAMRLVMLDTVVPGATHGEMCAERLAFLDRTLAEQPDRPTLIAMHHPAFTVGVRHLDAIGLRDASAFAAIVSRHPQVRRIVAGHHHRAIVGQIAHAIATVSPAVVHQTELDFSPDASGDFVLEPPAYQMHLWRDDSGMVTHTALVDTFPGPYPFLTEPDYPGG